MNHKGTYVMNIQTAYRMEYKIINHIASKQKYLEEQKTENKFKRISHV